EQPQPLRIGEARLHRLDHERVEGRMAAELLQAAPAEDRHHQLLVEKEGGRARRVGRQPRRQQAHRPAPSRFRSRSGYTSHARATSWYSTEPTVAGKPGIGGSPISSCGTTSRYTGRSAAANAATQRAYPRVPTRRPGTCPPCQRRATSFDLPT